MPPIRQNLSRSHARRRTQSLAKSGSRGSDARPESRSSRSHPRSRLIGRRLIKPSQGDAVLVSLMGNGENQYAARTAGTTPLGFDPVCRSSGKKEERLLADQRDMPGDRSVRGAFKKPSDSANDAYKTNLAILAADNLKIGVEHLFSSSKDFFSNSIARPEEPSPRRDGSVGSSRSSETVRGPSEPTSMNRGGGYCLGEGRTRAIRKYQEHCCLFCPGDTSIYPKEKLQSYVVLCGYGISYSIFLVVD